MRWNSDPNGSGYRIRQFDKPAGNSMQNYALSELTAPKRRPRRSLRLILPSWLSGSATRAAKQMEEEMKEPKERND